MSPRASLAAIGGSQATEYHSKMDFVRMSSLASAPQSIADSCASDTSPHTLKTPLTSNSVRSHY
jgi:hypothetical protein